MIKDSLDALLKGIFLYFSFFFNIFKKRQSLHASWRIVVKRLWALLLPSGLFIDLLGLGGKICYVLLSFYLVFGVDYDSISSFIEEE
jgi:hypothetical protein